MKKSIVLPGKYIQGKGVIAETGGYVKMLGKKPAIVWGKRTRQAVHDAMAGSLKQAELELFEVLFNGECTKEEAHRVLGLAKGAGCDVIVGVGGEN